MEKKALEAIFGEVLTTTEALEKYEFICFSAPFAEVRRRADGCRGTLEFQDRPRFYFNFVEASSSASSIPDPCLKGVLPKGCVSTAKRLSYFDGK